MPAGCWPAPLGISIRSGEIEYRIVDAVNQIGEGDAGDGQRGVDNLRVRDTGCLYTDGDGEVRINS